MRIKISLLIITICCLIVLAFSNDQFSSPNTPIKIKQTTLSTVLQEQQEQKEEINKPIKTTINEVNTAIKTPISSHVYDTDPMIEAHLIFENNKRCYQQLSTHKRMVKINKEVELKLSEKQKSFFKSYKKYCQDLNELHPEFKLTDIAGLRSQQKGTNATSQWGRIITGEIDVATLDDYEISGILKKNDLNTLTMAPKYLEEYYQKIIHWGLEDVLQNHQYDYINYIQHLTHQLYLCELGADCTPTSTIMVRLCYQNSMNCGLDYQIYIDSMLTQGMQADIKLAYEYLKSQYQ